MRYSGSTPDELPIEGATLSIVEGKYRNNVNCFFVSMDSVKSLELINNSVMYSYYRQWL